MKKERQEKILRALNSGKYRVDIENGIVYYYHKGTNSWRPKQATTLTTGYKQHILYFGRGKGKGIAVYEHHVIWLASGNSIPTGYQIDHIDSNTSNNRFDNLQTLTVTNNLKRRPERIIEKQYDRIRDKEIREIYKLWLEGNSQRKIAQITGINRLTVRYHIKKLENKEQFKYSDLIRK